MATAERNVVQVPARDLYGITPDDTPSRTDEDKLFALQKQLSATLPLREVESLERQLKSHLREVTATPHSTDELFRLARFQKTLGLLAKLKSYTIKLSHPLGYSIFLHNPREGFSFQRHLAHKYEVFHILKVLPGAFVFACEYDEWKQVFNPSAFQRWLEGEKNEAYDQYRYQPKPGDIIPIDRLGIVHSVFGCILEEFATTSTDLVDRLHDQNQHRPPQSSWSRGKLKKILENTRIPSSSRVVRLKEGTVEAQDIVPTIITGGYRLTLSRGPVHANRYHITSTTNLISCHNAVSSLCILQGSGDIELSVSGESRSSSARIAVETGDTLTVPSGAGFRLHSTSRECIVSEQQVELETAFAVFE